MKKEKTLAWYKRKLWTVFSEYIRKRDKGVCFTCGAENEIRFTQCGHYYQRAICPLPLYFHERNNHCQCYRCNIWLRGNVAVYGARIREVYGTETLEELHALLGKIEQWKKEDYQELIEEYKEKIEAL